MKQRGELAAPLVPLDDLRRLVERPGPFLSVYLALPPASEELAEATQLDWQSLRETVAADGAPTALLELVDAQVEGAHREGAGLCVIAAAGAPAHVEHLAVAPPRQLARWDTSPALRPLLALRQWLQPHVIVLVDRRGADIATYRGSHLDPEARTAIDGDASPIRKVAPGGWSQRRFQQRAEETWHRNMVAVADQVRAAAQHDDARIVALGGDERALRLLEDELPANLRDRVRRIGVTRARDGSSAFLDDEIRAVLQRWADEQVDHTIEQYREELGQHDRATAGPADTLAALRAGQVAALLVPLDDAEVRRAWIGSSVDQVALDTDDGSGAEPFARPASLLDAAVAAALVTGAGVRVYEPGDRRPDDLGALLRW